MIAVFDALRLMLDVFIVGGLFTFAALAGIGALIANKMHRPRA